MSAFSPQRRYFPKRWPSLAERRHSDEHVAKVSARRAKRARLARSPRALREYR